MPGEGWVGIAPDGVDCGILAGRGMGLGLRIAGREIGGIDGIP